MLESFLTIKPYQIGAIHQCRNFMLDSGAFSFAISGRREVTRADAERLADRYCKFIIEHDVDKFFELDLDALYGWDWVRSVTDRIERETKRQPIPVWHPNRRWRGFEEMCERYPYVAIGTTDIRRQINRCVRRFTSYAHERGVKIHGLGYTDTSRLPMTGFDSVDSTAWLFGNMSGGRYEFDGRRMVLRRGGGKAKTYELASHNLARWLLYAERMRKQGR